MEKTHKNAYVIGADIGGTHISLAAFNLENGAVLPGSETRFPVDSAADSATILNGWTSAIRKQCDASGQNVIKGLGFAIPGPFFYGRGISRISGLQKYDQLFGLDLRQSLYNRLAAFLPVNPSDIRFINDAQAFLAGAAGDSAKKMMGITLGTGLGSAFYAQGKVLDYDERLPYRGLLYNAPFRGATAEDLLSARWLLNTFNQGRTDDPANNVFDLAGRAANDNEALALFQAFGATLGAFLKPVAGQFFPDRLVLGGNIARAYHLFGEAFREHFGHPEVEIFVAEETDRLSMSGAVKSFFTSGPSISTPLLRSSLQALLPVCRPPESPDHYDLYPSFPLPAGSIRQGFEELAQNVGEHRQVVIDGFSGVSWDDFCTNLNKALVAQGITADWFCIDAVLQPEAEIEALVAPWLGADDPLFGKICPEEATAFFDPDHLHRIRPAGRHLNILYGSGATLAGWMAGQTLYLDVPKNEIQYRSRAGRPVTFGANQALSPKAQYKRMYFVDWPVLNRHKQRLLPRIDIFVDEQRGDQITWITGQALRAALDVMKQNGFRVRPWFEPGAWGGQWLKKHVPQLNPSAINYAWSFEMIVPENGFILESDGWLLECSFDLLMYHDHDAVLGRAAARFGTEFPIRFDFLDTFQGGNLSLQCHPTTAYIREHFGENFTQDETYYILDAAPDAKVFLGFQEDVDPVVFRVELEKSRQENLPVAVEDYVQVFPAKKHDLFLIPAGTIHCSGRNNLVLEISNTPYIYTFKMYDWLRLDLDGKPRPLNLSRAFENLNFERRGPRVREELLSRPSVIREGNDWQVVDLPTHPEHFYAIHRLEFDSELTIDTEEQCHILNLVEGRRILVRTAKREMIIHYAETFTVPAAAGRYTLVNLEGGRAKVVKAFVK